MKYSVLDQSPTSAGFGEGEAIRNSLELARDCDQLGYERYWLSEHHNLVSVAGTAPEILAAAIAATTRRIRVGSAGVMLPHYSALKVAEQFRVLDAIAPGRIDLGVGRAPGSDPLTARALNPYSNVEEFPRQVQELEYWVSNTPLPVGHPFHAIKAHPVGQTRPQIWILGSSSYGAQVAAFLGLPYAFAYFFNDGEGVEQALSLYRENFKPRAGHERPQPTICVWALAADTAAEAARLATAREHWRIGFEKGLRAPLISPEAAAAHAYTPAERARIERLRADGLVGTGAEVAARLVALGERLELDEMVINTWTFNPEARRRSYVLLAQAFGLSGART